MPTCADLPVFVSFGASTTASLVALADCRHQAGHPPRCAFGHAGEPEQQYHTKSGGVWTVCLLLCRMSYRIIAPFAGARKKTTPFAGRLFRTVEKERKRNTRAAYNTQRGMILPPCRPSFPVAVIDLALRRAMCRAGAPCRTINVFCTPDLRRFFFF